MNEIDLPECFFDYDDNGNRTSLSYLGTIAVTCICVTLAYRFVQYLQNQSSAMVVNIDNDDVLK